MQRVQRAQHLTSMLVRIKRCAAISEAISANQDHARLRKYAMSCTMNMCRIASHDFCAGHEKNASAGGGSWPQSCCERECPYRTRCVVPPVSCFRVGRPLFPEHTAA